MKLASLIYLAGLMLPITIMGFAIAECNSIVWTMVFAIAIGITLFSSSAIATSSLSTTGSKVFFNTLASSLISTIVVFIWSLSKIENFHLANFSFAILLAALGIGCIENYTNHQNKDLKHLFVLWGVCFFVMASTCALESVSKLMLLPEWTTTAAYVLSYVSTGLFAMCIGAIAGLLYNIASEASSPGKLFAGFGASAFGFMSIGMIGSIIFDLLDLPRVFYTLISISRWGCCISVGCIVLLGLCYCVAKLCCKSR